MAKKKTKEASFDKAQDVPRTFKPMPEAQPEDTPQALEVTQQDKQALIAELLKVEGMNQELAEHMAAHGIPADSFTVQTFYRVSAVTADAVIKVFTEVTK